MFRVGGIVPPTFFIVFDHCLLAIFQLGLLLRYRIFYSFRYSH